MWTYAWIAFIVLCFAAAIAAAVMENMKRKKAIARRNASMSPSEAELHHDGDEVQDEMHDLGALDDIPAEPDFDFPQQR